MRVAEPSSAILAVVESTGVLLLAFLQTVVLVLLYLGPETLGQLQSEAELLPELPMILLLQALVFVVLGLLAIRLRIRREEPVGRTGPLGAVLIGLAGAGLAFGLSLVIGTVQSWLGVPVQEQDWVLALADDRETLLRLAPLAVLLAPVSEEIFFRAYMFRFLSQRAGPGVAYGVSSVLFGLIHFNPSGLAVYIGIGLVLAFVYRRSSSLIAPVVGHVCFNALALLTLAYTR